MALFCAVIEMIGDMAQQSEYQSSVHRLAIVEVTDSDKNK